MSSPIDLTTLANVKAWLAITTTNSDALLSSLITAMSRTIYSNLGRASLLPRTFTERYDGQANHRMYLRNWPVLSVSSLVNWGTTIPQGTPPGPNQPIPNGFIIQPWDGTPPGQPQAIDIYGQYIYFGNYAFSRGRQNVSIVYEAGYQVTGEAWTVPTTPFQVTALAQYGPWWSDQGVTYAATGVALVPVASGPTVGQYSVSTGLYTFSAADAGKGVLISYGFLPQDVVEVATELVGERFSYMGRIGLTSKSLGGQETMAYSQRPIPPTLDLMLQPFRAVYIPP